MATYSVWQPAAGPALTSDTAGYDLGTEFYVTTTTCTLTGYWFWVPSGGSVSGTRTFRCWSVTTGTTGSLVTGSQVTASAMTAGQWNFTTLTPAVTLTSGQRYRVTISANPSANWYGSTANYFSSGGGSADIVNGSLTCPNNAHATGSVQGSFNTPSAGTFPASTFNSGAYFVDVQVTDSAAGNLTLNAPVVTATGAAPAPRFPPPPFTATTDADPGLARPGYATPGNPLAPSAGLSVTAGRPTATGYAPAPPPPGGVPGDITVTAGPTTTRAQVILAGPVTADGKQAGNVQQDGKTAGPTLQDGKTAGPTTVDRRR